LFELARLGFYGGRCTAWGAARTLGHTSGCGHQAAA
jgi:hypothetical protein